MIWNYWPEDLGYFLNHITLWLAIAAVLVKMTHMSFLTRFFKSYWVVVISLTSSFLFLPLAVAWIGPLSLISGLWAIHNIFLSVNDKKISMQKSEQNFLLYFLSITGVILYLLSEGLFIWDLYRWGWHPFFSFVLIGFLCVFCIKKWSILFFGLVMILVVDALNILPSDNMWDILLDPFVVIGSFIYLIKRIRFNKKITALN